MALFSLQMITAGLVIWPLAQPDKDTGRAWRFSPTFDQSNWTQNVLRGDGGKIATHAHWSWREPMRAALTRPIKAPQPDIRVQKAPDGTLHLTAQAPSDASTLTLRLRSSTAARLIAVNGVASEMALPEGQWVQVSWATARQALSLAIRPRRSGKLEVRYRVTTDRWPAAAALPARPADLMAWDDSDSTFVVGTRAFTW